MSIEKERVNLQFPEQGNLLKRGLNFLWKIRRVAAEATKLHYTLGAMGSVGILFASESNTLMGVAGAVSLVYSGLACRVIELAEGVDDIEEIHRIEGPLNDSAVFEHIANRSII